MWFSLNLYFCLGIMEYAFETENRFLVSAGVTKVLTETGHQDLVQLIPASLESTLAQQIKLEELKTTNGKVLLLQVTLCHIESEMTSH